LNGQNFTDKIGTFTSPNYPVAYYNNADCRWRLIATSTTEVSGVLVAYVCQLMYKTEHFTLGVINDAVNTFDYVPICMQVCMVVDRIKFVPRHRVPKPAWYKASDSDISSYKNCLLQNLSDLDIPFTALLCRNVMCSDPSHTAALQSLASSIAAACVTAALSSIPQTNNRQESGRIPGWNDFVAPYRSKSLFWHNIWVACERPRNGVVSDIMRRTRAQYH